MDNYIWCVLDTVVDNNSLSRRHTVADLQETFHQTAQEGAELKGLSLTALIDPNLKCSLHSDSVM